MDISLMRKLITAIIFLAAGCGDSTGPEIEGYTVIPPENPQPAGDRLFGIAPTESEQGSPHPMRRRRKLVCRWWR